MIPNKIKAIQAVIKLGIKGPMCQHQLQIGQLIINISRPLFNLPVMHLQQLALQTSPCHPVDKRTNNKPRNG
ncbi:hypothetical protein D3C76_1293310 [compost metagenome]